MNNINYYIICIFEYFIYLLKTNEYNAFYGFIYIIKYFILKMVLLFFVKILSFNHFINKNKKKKITFKYSKKKKFKY